MALIHITNKQSSDVLPGNLPIGATHHIKPFDERPRRGLWAPGGYDHKCIRCSELFIGDKRAVECADCAYKEPDATPETERIRYHGWHWYHGIGNSRDSDGVRQFYSQHWAVLCWTFEGIGYASSACWVAPLRQDEMHGTWGPEIIPPTL